MSRYIDEYRGRFGVEPICRVLDVSASAADALAGPPEREPHLAVAVAGRPAQPGPGEPRLYRHRRERVVGRGLHLPAQLAIVEWVAWFNNNRLHESLGDLPPAEFETLRDRQYVLISPSLNGEETS